MAQNQFINVTVDAGAAKKPDIQDHRHQTSNGAASTGDLTLSWDSTKFTSVNMLKSAVAACILKAMGQMS
jgi:hypothetical protein